MIVTALTVHNDSVRVCKDACGLANLSNDNAANNNAVREAEGIAIVGPHHALDDTVCKQACLALRNLLSATRTSLVREGQARIEYVVAHHTGMRRSGRRTH